MKLPDQIVSGIPHLVRDPQKLRVLAKLMDAVDTYESNEVQEDLRELAEWIEIHFHREDGSGEGDHHIISVFMDPEIHAMAERLATEDNRATAHPLWIVQERERIYGMDSDWCSDSVWIETEEGTELDEYESHEAQTREDRGETVEGAECVGYVDRWRFVTATLTSEAARAYINRNGHNLREPRVYADSGNPEWQLLRKFFLSFASTLCGDEEISDVA